MRSGVSRARSRRGVVAVRAVVGGGGQGAGGEGGEGAPRDAEVPTRDDVEAGRRAVAEVADDGARTPSQQALDGKGNEQKTPGLFELKAPRERALALHESQQRSPNGPHGTIVAASPARA